MASLTTVAVMCSMIWWKRPVADLDSVDDRLSSIVSGGYLWLTLGDRQVNAETSYRWDAAGE